jgi:hypothetical protein
MVMLLSSSSGRQPGVGHMTQTMAATFPVGGPVGTPQVQALVARSNLGVRRWLGAAFQAERGP